MTRTALAVFTALVCATALTGCGGGGGGAGSNMVVVAPLDTTSHYTAEKLPGQDGDSKLVFDINDSGMIAGEDYHVVIVWMPGTRSIEGLGSYSRHGRTINSAGQVAGSEQVEPETPVMWQYGHAPRLLTVAAGLRGVALDVNAAGDIVGYVGSYDEVSMSTVPEQAVVWKNGTTCQSLPTPNGATSIAGSINDSGQILGSISEGGTDRFRPVIWSADGQIQYLQYPANCYPLAGSMNNAGVVAGKYLGEGDTETPVIWDSPTRPRVLGILTGYTGGAVTDINDHGQACGYVSKAPRDPDPYRAYLKEFRAVLWNPDGGIVDLGIPEGLVNSKAEGINNQGHIVGNADDGRGPAQGFIWTRVQ